MATRRFFRNNYFGILIFWLKVNIKSSRVCFIFLIESWIIRKYIYAKKFFEMNAKKKGKALPNKKGNKYKYIFCCNRGIFVILRTRRGEGRSSDKNIYKKKMEVSSFSFSCQCLLLFETIMNPFQFMINEDPPLASASFSFYLLFPFPLFFPCVVGASFLF